jgi:hypothetical protein
MRVPARNDNLTAIPKLKEIPPATAARSMAGGTVEGLDGSMHPSPGLDPGAIVSQRRCIYIIIVLTILHYLF